MKPSIRHTLFGFQLGVVCHSLTEGGGQGRAETSQTRDPCEWGTLLQVSLLWNLPVVLQEAFFPPACCVLPSFFNLKEKKAVLKNSTKTEVLQTEIWKASPSRIPSPYAHMYCMLKVGILHGYLSLSSQRPGMGTGLHTCCWSVSPQSEFGLNATSEEFWPSDLNLGTPSAAQGFPATALLLVGVDGSVLWWLPCVL